ncbi:MAG: U32 family peptidase [Lachnospiraceae bacterium]|nr:U32 family peptidase [Lachnospiraceae bacterium]
MKKPELLVPAGSLEVLKTAVRYGADAVYIGGEAFSLRAKAKNFSLEEMDEGIKFAHEHGVRVHVTANIYAHDRDMDEAREYFTELSKLRPDAILIADPGLFMLEREICPEIPVHISTQANNTNYKTFEFWHKLGAERVVCAREMTLDEIRELRDKIPEDMDIECFIHGAMCISYSGRCLLSAYMTGRSANRGECTHPCRWKYGLVEEMRPGEYMPVEENDRGTFIFNSKDLCMIEHIPEMIEAGINSFKIEGRMKTALYVATVARTYRKAIDDWFLDPQIYRNNIEWYKSEIAKCTYRNYTTGFYFGNPGVESQIYDNSTYVVEYVYLGIIEEVTGDGRIRLTQKNKFCVGDSIEIMKPGGDNIFAAVTDIKSEDGISQESAPHACQVIYVTLDPKDGNGPAAQVGDVLRMKA